MKPTKALIKKRLKFLDDTVKFYNSNNRAIKPTGSCQYYIGKGKPGCAIGRHLLEKLAKSLDRMKNSSVNAESVFNRLPKELKDLGRGFLYKIQDLHDDDFCWDTHGLSRFGEGKVGDIKKEFCE